MTQRKGCLSRDSIERLFKVWCGQSVRSLEPLPDSGTVNQVVIVSLEIGMVVLGANDGSDTLPA